MMASRQYESLPLDIYMNKTDLENVGVVLNIRSGTRQCDLRKNLKSSFDAPSSAVFSNANCPHVALVVFERPVHSLHGKRNTTMKILPVTAPKGLVVEIVDFEDPLDILCYFDEEESVINGDYSSIDVYPDIAIIKLLNPGKVLPLVLSKRHKVDGQILHLEPYISEFHDEVVASYPCRPQTSTSISYGRKSSKPLVCWTPVCPSSQTNSQVNMHHSSSSSTEGCYPEYSSDSDEIDHRSMSSACKVDHYTDSCGTTLTNNGMKSKKYRKQKTDTVSKYASSSESESDDASGYSRPCASGATGQTTQKFDVDAFCEEGGDRVLVSKIMCSKKGQTFLKSFEKENQCKIEVQFMTRPKQPKSQLEKSAMLCGNKHSSTRHQRNGRDSAALLKLLDLSATSNPRRASSHLHNSCGQSSTTFTINGVQIISKRGNIAKEKADVIVNVVGQSRDFLASCISKAIVDIGGKELLGALKRSKAQNPRGTVIPTKGINLQCQQLITIVLDTWKGISTEQVKEFSKILEEVFELAMSQGFTSVALPIMGCGRMLQYPMGKSVSCLVSEVIKASNNQHFQKICLVAYDVTNHKLLNDELEKYSNYANHAQNTKMADSAKTVNVADVINSSIEITADHNKLAGVRTHLQRDLYCDVLYSVMVQNPTVSSLSLRMKGKIYEVANFPKPRLVRFEIDSRTGDVQVIGEKDDVSICEKDIEMLFSSKFPQSSKQLRCSSEIWLHLAFEIPQTPPYWTSVPRCRPIPAIFKSGRLRSQFSLEQVEPHIDKAIRQLVKKTWQSANVGHGQDAINLHHKNIKIQKIERIENLDLFDKYAKRRQEYFHSLSVEGIDSYQQVEDLRIRNGGVILSSNALDDSLKEDLFPEINEHYFFHGTKPDVIKTVLRQGLDFRMSSNKAMFGMGIYGAESPTKADQYVDSKHNRTRGQKQMLLMRMMLGRPYICSSPNPRKYRRPPCLHPECRRDDCVDSHDRFDSVIGDGPWLFREFVVYAADQSYPEYLITYERI